ncbi:MAG: TolC family protein [Ignavibacteria bacterium]|nr:TolC family protein [Ignavibacteria bacterium]
MNKLKSSFKLVLGFVLIQSQITYSQELLTLEEATALALKNNYSIQIASNSAKIADNNLSLGNAGFLPKLDVSGSSSRSVVNTKQEYSNGQIVDRNNAGSTSLGANISLNWTIFDGLNMFITYDKLKEIKESGELQLKSKIEEIISQVIKTYYDIVEQTKIYNVIKQALEISEQRVKIIQDKFNLGAASKLELLQAKVDYNSDHAGLLNQELKLKHLKVTLNNLLKREIEIDFSTQDSIEIKRIEQSVFMNGVKNNTSYLLAEKDLSISSLNLSSSRSKWFPKIGVFGGYNYSQSKSEAGFFKSNTSYGLNYGLNLSLNLFEGFNLNREIENAKLNEINSELMLKETKNRLEAELAKISQTYFKSLDIVELEKENLSVAKENLDIALEKLQLGAISPIEFREAQVNFISAQSRLISALHSVKYSEVDILRLTGNLIK